jgi:hypothetical protein
MYLICLIFTVLLYVVLTPSNFVRLPQNGNKWIVSIVHGIIFVAILHFTYHYCMSSKNIIEGAKVKSSSTKKNCDGVCGKNGKYNAYCNHIAVKEKGKNVTYNCTKYF